MSEPDGKISPNYLVKLAQLLTNFISNSDWDKINKVNDEIVSTLKKLPKELSPQMIDAKAVLQTAHANAIAHVVEQRDSTERELNNFQTTKVAMSAYELTKQVNLTSYLSMPMIWEAVCLA